MGKLTTLVMGLASLTFLGALLWVAFEGVLAIVRRLKKIGR